MAWDVMSRVTKTAWDVMSGVTKTAWDVLSGVANLCGMFCPGCKKWHGMFCPGMFCPAPDIAATKNQAIPNAIHYNRNLTFYIHPLLVLFVFILYVPVNISSVMSGWVSRGSATMSIPKMSIPIMSTIPKCLFPLCLLCQNVYSQNVYSFGKNELMMKNRSIFKYLKISIFCHRYNYDLGQCTHGWAPVR